MESCVDRLISEIDGGRDYWNTPDLVRAFVVSGDNIWFACATKVQGDMPESW